MDDIKENYFYDKTIKIIKLMLVFVLIILLTGFSYSFFVYNKTGLYTHTITGGKMSIIYNETTGNNITIDNAYPLRDEEALTQGLEFEFTITGYNESDKNIYYAIEMDYGEDVEDKTRFKDSDLKLSLFENEEEVFENEVFDNLDKQNIHYGYISQGTNSETSTTNSYKLKLWINDNVIISDTISSDLSTWTDFEWDFLQEYNLSVYNSLMNSDSQDLSDYGISIYTSEEFQKMYANFKVNVTADLTYDDIGYVTYDANGGEFTPKKTSLTTNRITLQKPVMEGKGFLGWSSTPNGEVEYYSGDTYTGNGKILYAVYGNKVNKIVEDFLWVENENGEYPYGDKVYFINDTQVNIDERYNNSVSKWDLSYDESSNVKGWIETDATDGSSILYIASEGTTYLTNGSDLFYNMTFMDLSFDNLDTSMVTDMSGMFSEVNIEFHLDLTGFNTSNVTNMSGMFGSYGGVIKSIDAGTWDTSKVTDMSAMFKDCELEYLNIENWDTSNVTTMHGMFEGCENLISLDLSHFNTSKVTEMAYMFTRCNFLKEDSLRNFDTSNVTSMYYMFSGCSITTLNLDNFDTSSVTSMFYTFAYCYELTDLNISNFDTSKVEDMSHMFSGCSNLTSLDVSHFDTSLVTDMSNMFSYCSSLTSLNVSNFDTSKVVGMSKMFSGCTNLIELNLTNFDINEVKSTEKMFDGCSSLKTIYCNNDWNVATITTSKDMFNKCTSLVGAVSFDSSKIDITMANPNTGYFTRIV